MAGDHGYLQDQPCCAKVDFCPEGFAKRRLIDFHPFLTVRSDQKVSEQQQRSGRWLLAAFQQSPPGGGSFEQCSKHHVSVVANIKFVVELFGRHSHSQKETHFDHLYP